jgi:ABC-type sugar transport system permease subunit
MPPSVTYHTRYAQRDWGLFALYVLAGAIAFAILGFAMERDEVRASRARAEYLATTLADRMAIAGATPGSDVGTWLAPLALAQPDLHLAVVEEQSSNTFEYLAQRRYIGQSDAVRIGADLDPNSPDDRRVLALVLAARQSTHQHATLQWTGNVISAAATAPSGTVTAVVQGLKPHATSRRPRTIAWVAFVILVIFSAGLHDVLPRIGRYVNVFVLAAGIAIVALLGQALAPSLWRGTPDDLLIRKAEALRLTDLARLLSQDLPAPVSAVTRWGRVAALSGLALYLVALTGVFHRLGRLVRTESFAYRLAAPAFVLLLILGAAPLGATFVLPFLHATPTEAYFVGSRHFIEVLAGSSEDAGAASRVVAFALAWVTGSALLQVAVALLLTLAVSPLSRRLRRVARAFLVAPWALPAFVAAIIGGHLGRGSEPSWVVALAISAWMGAPPLAYLGAVALERLPDEAVESLELDGVRGLRRVLYLTLPFLMRLSGPALALAALQSTVAFAVLDLTSGASGGELPVQRALQWGFDRLEFGVSAVWTLLGLIMVLLPAAVLAWSVRRHAEPETVEAGAGDETTREVAA